MSHGGKFNPAWAARLANPERLTALDPDALWAAAAKPGAQSIVDIGAGAGLMAIEFARRAPSATVYAADISDEMLAYLSAHLPDDLGTRVVPVLSEETSVPLPDGIADLVMVVAVYHEFDDADAILLEARRLLAPGGRLLIADWKKEPTPDGPPMDHRVEPSLILAHVSAAGFTATLLDEASLSDFAIISATR